MEDREVLQKAIDLAQKNGYYVKFSLRHNLEDYMVFRKYYVIIFSHDFAKAFWGLTQTSIVNYDNAIMERPYSFELGFTWQRHLMNMVLEERPIDYLRKFINTEKS